MKKGIFSIKNLKGNFGFLYFLSIMFILGMVYISIELSGERIIFYADIPTLAVVLIMPMSVMYILYGISNTKEIFSLPLKKEPSVETLNEALWFFKLLNKFVWFSSLMLFIINIVGILQSLDDLPLLASNYNKLIILAMLSPFYAVLISLFIIFPYNIIIKKQLKQHEIKNN